MAVRAGQCLVYGLLSGEHSDDNGYHVTSSGNGRQVIFWSDADRLRFLAQLADNVRTAAVVLCAYVRVDNQNRLS
jgi:hypothetical protein